MANFTKISFLLSLLFCGFSGFAQDPLPKITLAQVFSGLSSPVSLQSCNDDRIFIVEKAGIIKVGYPDGSVLPAPFLDIRDRVKSGGERGLLGLAFPPDFKQSGMFYVNYTGEDDAKTVVSRFRVSADSNLAIKETEEKLLRINQPFSNHNGGNIEFGMDGYLYIGMGDGGSGGDPQNNSQNKQSLLGKMLRIDVSQSPGYKIPADNPFAGNNEYRPEIWAVGMRNPWRFKFDERNGDLWIADVGQGKWEEIDYEPFDSPGGLNYGWRCYEGYEAYNTSGCLEESYYTFPVAAFGHNAGHCSITGGVVDIKDPNSSLYGHYISTDYCSGQFWGTKKNPDQSFTTIELAKPSFASFVAFGYDLEKNIYVATDNGNIYRIDTFVLCTNDLAIQGEENHVGCETDQIIITTQSLEGGEYTWFLDGQPLSDSDNDTLIVTQAGEYTVQFISAECSAVSLQPFIVLPHTELNVRILDLPGEYCVNGAPLTLQGDPAGGEFFGPGIEGSVFNPAVSNVGTFTITYFYEDAEGCSGFDVATIKVNRAPETTILSTPPNQCLQGPPYSLEATPVEGYWTGSGVSGNTFYPDIAGVGVHKLVYTYNPWEGCYAYDSIYMTVINCTSGTRSTELSAYTLYPNPVAGELILQTKDLSTLPRHIRIINSVGRTVTDRYIKNADFSNDLIKIGMEAMKPGAYTILVTDDRGQYITKVIKI